MIHVADPNLLIALVTGSLSLIAAVAVASINAKSSERMAAEKEKAQKELAEKREKAQNDLIAYKIDQLAEKVEKHNHVVEDVTILKHDMETVWKRYDDMKQAIEQCRGENDEQKRYQRENERHS